jgi:hypothetical protein
MITYEGIETGTMYFSPRFIRDPNGPILAGWEFDFSTAIHCTPEHWTETHHPECFEGVLVKSEQHIWRLTGKTDSQGYFEGKWPD